MGARVFLATGHDVIQGVQLRAADRREGWDGPEPNSRAAGLTVRRHCRLLRSSAVRQINNDDVNRNFFDLNVRATHFVTVITPKKLVGI